MVKSALSGYNVMLECPLVTVFGAKEQGNYVCSHFITMIPNINNNVRNWTRILTDSYCSAFAQSLSSETYYVSIYNIKACNTLEDAKYLTYIEVKNNDLLLLFNNDFIENALLLA